jgi:hypothetical protein
MSVRIAQGASSFLARATSRRGFLARSAVVGSALTVAPIRFLVYPVTAEAANRSECSPGSRCRDGWTEFCCAVGGIEQNECPSYTFYGGYWRCGNYEGTGYCGGTPDARRYYVDCNLRPEYSATGNCARGDCGCRVTAFNRFQYGNCNAHRSPNGGESSGGNTTKVVCRKVMCHNPADDNRRCSYSNKAEPVTCRHEPCRNCL